MYLPKKLDETAVSQNITSVDDDLFRYFADLDKIIVNFTESSRFQRFQNDCHD